LFEIFLFLVTKDLEAWKSAHACVNVTLYVLSNPSFA
jgi:hypothetical protein